MDDKAKTNVEEPTMFWESIRNHSGWAWALGELRRVPGRLDERGKNWGESPLHWAMLGSLEATAEILPSRPDLLFARDAASRSPLDWAVEKIYFLRERQTSELSSQRAKSEALVGQARACALHAINWLGAGEPREGWSGDAGLLLRCALSAGELELAQGIDGLGSKAPVETWLAGLAGFWRGQGEATAYVQSLASRYGMDPDAVVCGRPLGLHVAWLWAEKKISEQQADWFHQAGARVDQETTEESIELFCSSDAAGAARLDRLQKRLGL